MAEKINAKLLKDCEKKLLDLRESHLMTLREMKQSFSPEESGDTGDMARRAQDLQFSMAKSQKLTQDLREIDEALHRIKEGTYGICEETGELIEENRLRALPWARLSLEGAEIRASEFEIEARLGA